MSRAPRFGSREVRAAVALAILLSATNTVAQEVELSVRVPAPERFRLQNGLDVVLQGAPHQSSVAVVMSYDVGLRDEPDGYEQLAHLVEHMTFQGSRHLPALRASEFLEHAGLRDGNGVTRFDDTVYFSVVPSRALPLVLWIESERMAFTLERFDAARLDHERAIVRNELLSIPQPATAFFDHFRRAVFGDGHPYARNVDQLADLDAIDVDDARWFFQQGYRPSNAHLVVVGDFDRAKAVAEVHKYFGAIVNPSVSVTRTKSGGRAFATSRRLRMESPVHLRQSLVAWPAPELGSPKRAAAEIFVQLLTTRFESQFLYARREVSRLSFRIHDFALGSIVVLQADLTTYTNQDDLERELLEELAGAREQDLDALLAETKTRAVLEELRGVEDPLRFAERHVEALRYLRRPYEPARRVSELRAVSLADLVEFRRSLLGAKTVVASLARPTRSAPVDGVERIEPP